MRERDGGPSSILAPDTGRFPALRRLRPPGRRARIPYVQQLEWSDCGDDVECATLVVPLDWDEIDGAAWASALAGRNTAFLIQESIGDPVVPNVGSEMVAAVTSAKQVGAVLDPIAAGIPPVPEAAGESAITQFRVDSTDPYKIHGFAGTGTPAGLAARAQISAFVTSVWAGAPKITVPAGCAKGSCDFSHP